MGLFFKSKKKRGKKIAIFDIGSSSIAGAYVLLPKNNEEEIPIVLESVRLEIKEAVSKELVDQEKEVVITLKKTAQALLQKKVGKLDEVVCVITTPWCHSLTKKISVSNRKEISITKKMLDDLVTKELQSITKTLDNEHDGSKEIVEKLVTEILIDDVPTDNPIGKDGQFLDLSLSYSYTNKNLIDKANDALLDVFYSTPISFSAFSILTYLMIRDYYPGQESHLILDISGETTDLSVINNGMFSQKYSFPFGKKTLFKHLALSLKIEERDAYELFKLYYQNNLSLTHREKLKKYFEIVEKFWSEELKHCLDTIPKYYKLPNTIFLTIDNDMRNWFFEVFKKTELAQNITLGKKFNIIILDESEMVDKCDLREGCHDPFIMIEAIALSRK